MMEKSNKGSSSEVKKERKHDASNWSTREGLKVKLCGQLSLSDGWIDKVLVWCKFCLSRVSPRVNLLSTVMEELISITLV